MLQVRQPTQTIKQQTNVPIIIDRAEVPIIATIIDTKPSHSYHRTAFTSVESSNICFSADSNVALVRFFSYNSDLYRAIPALQLTCLICVAQYPHVANRLCELRIYHFPRKEHYWPIWPTTSMLQSVTVIPSHRKVRTTNQNISTNVCSLKALLNTAVRKYCLFTSNKAG